MDTNRYCLEGLYVEFAQAYPVNTLLNQLLIILHTIEVMPQYQVARVVWVHDRFFAQPSVAFQ